MTSTAKKILKFNPIDEDLSKSKAKTLRSQIKVSAKNNIESDLDFCEKVFYAKSAFVKDGSEIIPFYEYCGKKSFKEYVEQEVGITENKAKKYSKIYSKYFVELADIFDPKKHALDITKLEILMPRIDSDNLDLLIRQARTADLETLKALYKPKKTTSNGVVSFRINKKEEKYIHKALKVAKKEFGKDLTDGQLLIAICTEYLENV